MAKRRSKIGKRVMRSHKKKRGSKKIRRSLKSHKKSVKRKSAKKILDTYRGSKSKKRTDKNIRDHIKAIERLQKNKKIKSIYFIKYSAIHNGKLTFRLEKRSGISEIVPKTILGRENILRNVATLHDQLLARTRGERWTDPGGYKYVRGNI